MGTYFAVDQETPSNAIDLVHIYGLLPLRYVTLHDLISEVSKLDCFDLLQRLDAPLYVRQAKDEEGDFLLIVSTYVDDPRFTHYLLTRDDHGSNFPIR